MLMTQPWNMTAVQQVLDSRESLECRVQMVFLAALDRRVHKGGRGGLDQWDCLDQREGVESVASMDSRCLAKFIKDFKVWLMTDCPKRIILDSRCLAKFIKDFKVWLMTDCQKRIILEILLPKKRSVPLLDDQVRRARKANLDCKARRALPDSKAILEMLGALMGT